MDASPAPACVEQFFEPEQVEILGPRLWAVKIAVEVFPDATLGILPQLRGVAIEVLEERLVEAVALVRRRPERHLDHRVDGKERDLGLVGRAADLIVRDDAL